MTGAELTFSTIATKAEMNGKRHEAVNSPARSNGLGPARLHILTFPKQHHQPGIKCSNVQVFYWEHCSFKAQTHSATERSLPCTPVFMPLSPVQGRHHRTAFMMEMCPDTFRAELKDQRDYTCSRHSPRQDLNSVFLFFPMLLTC